MEAQLYETNPWKGTRYEKNDHPPLWKGRTAVIGESTYGQTMVSAKSASDRSLPTDYCFNTEAHARGQKYNFKTKKFVISSERAERDSTPRLNHWTKIYHTFYPNENVSRRDFWDSVLSFNYVNRRLRGKEEEATPQDLIDSEEAFLQFLRMYRPEYVVIFSSLVADYLIKRGIITLEGAAEQARYGTIKLDDLEIKVCALHHVRAYGASPSHQNEHLRKLKYCPLVD